MREIVLDTETTGLSPADGHRIVEIGGIELVNHIPSGRTFHAYLNPEREVPAEAFAVHGLSTDFLRGKPVFADLADQFLTFIDGAMLVIHNAAFDTGFLNASSGASAARRSWPSARSTPWRWPGRSIHSARTALTRCAGATASTTRSATSTARCSMPSSWRMSISS